MGSHEAFLAYEKFWENGFKKSIDDVVNLLLGELPEPEKEDVAGVHRGGNQAEVKVVKGRIEDLPADEL